MSILFYYFFGAKFEFYEKDYLKKRSLYDILNIEKVFYPGGEIMAATISDVARLAGVSITTVSRVINNNYPVKEETRRKVERAIKELDYKPNLLARSLINKKTKSLGVVVPSITNLFFPVVVKGIQNISDREGFSLFLCDTDSRGEKEKKQIQNLIEKQVDGILVIDPLMDNIENDFYEKIALNIPLVIVNGYHKGIRANFVLSDQEMGMIQAMEYLIGLGHKDIAFLRGKDSYSYDLKEALYYELLKKHKIAVKEENILKIKDGNGLETVALTIEIVEERLEKANGPTAIIACNDWMGIGAVQAAKKLGKSVPKDLSVIGYDNILISELSEPRLTTVDQNMYALGETAAKLLIEIIEDTATNFKKIIMDTHLIIRDSCAAPGKI